METSQTICFVNACFYPHLGGVERYTLELSKKLVGLGYRVIILTANTNDSKFYEVYEGMTIYRLPIFKKLGSRYPILKFNKQYFKTLHKIRQEAIDVFVMNARFYWISLLGLHLAKKSNKKAVVIEHGTGHFTVNNWFLDVLGRGYEHLLMRLVKLYRPRFFGVSRACNLWLKHFGVTASGVAYNGINAFYDVQNKVAIQSAYQLPEDALVISFAGRMIEEKGVLVLLEAIKEIVHKNEHIYFFLAGSGPLSSQVSDAAARHDQVFYMGRLAYDDLMNLFRCTDVLVHPSNYPEGLPTVILEAGSYGCAIIATPQGGTEEIVLDEQHGMIIPAENAAVLAKSISKMDQDRLYLKSSSKLVKARVLERFDWHVLASDFMNTIA